jgi:hypothetical protein
MGPRYLLVANRGGRERGATRFHLIAELTHDGTIEAGSGMTLRRLISRQLLTGGRK